MNPIAQISGEKLSVEELKEAILNLQKNGEIEYEAKYGVDEYLHISGQYVYYIFKRPFDIEIDL